MKYKVMDDVHICEHFVGLGVPPYPGERIRLLNILIMDAGEPMPIYFNKNLYLFESVFDGIVFVSHSVQDIIVLLRRYLKTRLVYAGCANVADESTWIYISKDEDWEIGAGDGTFEDAYWYCVGTGPNGIKIASVIESIARGIIHMEKTRDYQNE